MADSHCDLPADMTAVSMNVTAVPIDGGPVGYVTVWGTPQDAATEPPPTSTLNAAYRGSDKKCGHRHHQPGNLMAPFPLMRVTTPTWFSM